LTDAEWKKVLPKDVYEVTRNADTERPLQGKYWNTDEKEPIIALLAAINYFVLELNFLVAAVGQAFRTRQ
jgi:peptide methionine sulfoxide reductase MsrB